MTNRKAISNFQQYSCFYDLLYSDKDYVAEAQYVSRKIRSANSTARTLLEFGSGTGRHGRILAAEGFDVHGIERSSEMAAVAGAVTDGGPTALGSFTCEVGDICDINLRRKFDAVIGLFHVMSYQTTNRALHGAFRVAANHLASGGRFLFDVWHGPAVLFKRPVIRIKHVADDRVQVRRTAQPVLDTDLRIVSVTYLLDCKNQRTGEITHFSEKHVMRYLFPSEVARFAAQTGFVVEGFEEFLTGKPATTETWGVAYMLRKA